jgi:BRCA1 C Terminus (BRCT) domain
VPHAPRRSRLARKQPHFKDIFHDCTFCLSSNGDFGASTQTPPQVEVEALLRANGATVVQLPTVTASNSQSNSSKSSKGKGKARSQTSTRDAPTVRYLSVLQGKEGYWLVPTAAVDSAAQRDEVKCAVNAGWRAVTVAWLLDCVGCYRKLPLDTGAAADCCYLVALQ